FNRPMRLPMELPTNAVPEQRSDASDRVDHAGDRAASGPYPANHGGPLPASRGSDLPRAEPASGAVAQSQALAVVQTPDVLAPAPVEWERQLEPRSLRECQSLSKAVMASRLNFGTYGSEFGVMSTILAGRELGLQAMASLRAFHIIDNKPTLSAGVIVAMVLKSGV